MPKQHVQVLVRVHNRTNRRGLAQLQLSQLLFGVDLSPGELRVYKAKLLEAIARVDGLEQDRILTLDGAIAVPQAKPSFPGD